VCVTGSLGSQCPINRRFEVAASLLWSRDVARWCRCGLSVAGRFVRRCLTSHTMLPFPHPAHRTGWADFPLPALGEGCMVQSGNGKRVRSVFVKSRKSPRDTRIDCEIPSQWNCYCGCANRARFCVARASEHSSYRTALRAMDEVKAGTARVRFEAGMERRSSCYRTNTGYTTGTRKNRND